MHFLATILIQGGAQITTSTKFRLRTIISLNFTASPHRPSESKGGAGCNHILSLAYGSQHKLPCAYAKLCGSQMWNYVSSLDKRFKVISIYDQFLCYSHALQWQSSSIFVLPVWQRTLRKAAVYLFNHLMLWKLLLLLHNCSIPT